jgi:hypothetical protein
MSRPATRNGHHTPPRVLADAPGDNPLPRPDTAPGTLPSAAGGGRDERGRFTAGNGGGPGNPFARRTAALRNGSWMR